MQSCAKSLKRLTLELGGNDPAIVCPDVDVADAASKITQVAFLNSGQICIAIKRIYVHSSIYSKFLAAMIEATRVLLVGDGFTRDVNVGPIQNHMQFSRVQEFLREIEDSKLRVAIGGNKAQGSAAFGKGYFIQPTVIDNPPDTSRIVTDEPFGPIVPVLQWDTEDEVILRANDTDAGLGASVWTKDLEKAQRIAVRLECGSVWINTHLEIQPDAAFGGHKKSGIGAEWGLEGLRSYCVIQTLFIPKA